MRWPGYPRYRDVSALFSVVYNAVLFALQAMRIESPASSALAAVSLRV